MADSTDRFLEDLSRRFPVDALFVSNIRPLVDRIFKDTTPGEERDRLLALVSKSFERQSQARDTIGDARDGIRRIFSNLFEQIVRDVSADDDKTAAAGADAEAQPDGEEDIFGDDASFDEWSEDGDGQPVWGEQQQPDGMPRRGDVLFGEFLVRRGVLDQIALLGALEEQVRNKPMMGWVAMRRGLLDESQLLDVLTRQAREDRRFGEIAIEAGYLDEGSLDQLRRVQKKYTPKLGRILVQRGDLSAEALDYFLEEYSVEIGRKD